ncbi:MAG: hypothetical protein E6G02_12970 [Actinobacteria bacterium]|nr:MAG: hypothetical protein E6G02_12970 [Actinomycetota bacterium]
MPRKVLLAFAAVLVAIALPAGAGADVYSLLDYQSATDALRAVDSTIDPPPNDPSRNFVVGGFHGTENNNVGFSANSDAIGLDPQGHLSETIPFFFGTPPTTYQGRFQVTCLAVVGNQAAMGLVPTDAASNDQTAEFILAVRDNRGLGIPDEYAFESGEGVFAKDCAFSVGDALFSIESGNILVNDALP